MHSPMFRDYLTLITLLLFGMSCAVSVEMNVERRSVDSIDPGAFVSPFESPYWEYILREFLFRTISPPPPANNKLYKELLEAPFYTGPFPAAGTFSYDLETSQVLSRGEIYHLAEGSWIICQEGCIDCEICTLQKSLTIPTVKWILTRIERHVPSANYKRHDLQITVLPQPDDSFHLKNLSPGSYVYVTSNDGAIPSFTDTLISQNKDHSRQYPFGATKSPGLKTPGDVFFSSKDKDQGLYQVKAVTEGPENDNKVFQTEPELETTSTLIPKTKNFPGRKRGREILQGGQNQRRIEGPKGYRKRVFNHSKPTQSSTPLTMFHPPTVPILESIGADCGMEKDTRIILGRDQFGEKQVVHIVPAGDLDKGITRPSVHPDARLLYRQPAHPHPVHNEHEERPLYRKIFQRVIDSLNTHKNAIEKFLFLTNREARPGHKQFPVPADGTFYKQGNTGLSYDENTITRNNITANVANSEDEDATSNDSKSVSYNRQEITGYSENMSSASATTEEFHEEDKVSTESYSGEVQVTTEDQTREFNHHLENFDKENSKESPLSDELIKRGNNSETLILKEVAKSVVNHPADSLQGFNSVANTSLNRDSDDDPSLTTSEGITVSAEYSVGREKSRRHV